MYIPPLPLCVAEIGELKVNLEMFSHPSTYWPCKLWNLWSKLFCWRMFVNHHLHGRLTLPKTNSKSPFSKKPQSSNHFSAEGFTDLSGKIMDAQVPKREGIWDSSQQKKYFLSLSSANDSKINCWLGIPTHAGDFSRKPCSSKKRYLFRLPVWGWLITFPWIPSKAKSFIFLWVSPLGSLNRTASLDLGHCVQLQVCGWQRQAWKNMAFNLHKKIRGLGVCVCVCVLCHAFQIWGWS